MRAEGPARPFALRGRRPLMSSSTSGAKSDRFGRATEWIARAMGTPWFLIGLTLFCALWMTWNAVMPVEVRFDQAALGFTALTLVLSLQASYAAPLILLAQNRQDDRDRVAMEQDRQRAERNLADTEYLAREIVALRLSLAELEERIATRESVRDELDNAIRRLTLDVREAISDNAAPATPTAPLPSDSPEHGRP